MPRLHDNTELLSEDDLIQVSKRNLWDVGDVLSNITGQIKIPRIMEELDDSGYIDQWANDYGYSKEDVYDMLIKAYDDKANLKVHRMLDGASVRCTMDVLGRVFYFCLDVLPEDFSALESRIRKLEKKILNNR